MPELPDITIYIEALERRILNHPLSRIRLASPFVLRTVEPEPSSLEGRRVLSLRRLGKRIVIEMEGEIFIVIHLMIAGRLRWEARGAKLSGKISLAAFDFPEGSLVLTEAGARKRASIHLLAGSVALAEHDPGGIDPIEATPSMFRERLLRGNHTLKRALTDPSAFSGIGNAYSDEILHRAGLSPLQLTSKLDDPSIDRLRRATRETMVEWISRLRAETGDGFPAKVTAFRDEMAVHGKFGQPCPVCSTPVQRIVYADNETNYCPRCQTGGRLLADRALSRLLRKDWPRSIDEQ